MSVDVITEGLLVSEKQIAEIIQPDVIIYVCVCVYVCVRACVCV